jgi:hypothetical protein
MVKIAIYKLVSLAVRVFTRPAYNYIKSVYMWNFLRTDWVGNRMMERLGKTKFSWEIWFADKLMPDRERVLGTGPRRLKELSRELTRNKGIDFFWDLMFYFTILGVGGYEAIMVYKNSEGKRMIEEGLSNDIDLKLAETYSRVNEIRANREEVISKLDEKLERLKSTLQKVIDETDRANDAEKIATENAIKVQHEQLIIKERIRQLLR